MQQPAMLAAAVAMHQSDAPDHHHAPPREGKYTCHPAAGTPPFKKAEEGCHASRTIKPPQSVHEPHTPTPTPNTPSHDTTRKPPPKLRTRRTLLTAASAAAPPAPTWRPGGQNLPPAPRPAAAPTAAWCRAGRHAAVADAAAARPPAAAVHCRRLAAAGCQGTPTSSTCTLSTGSAPGKEEAQQGPVIDSRRGVRQPVPRHALSGAAAVRCVAWEGAGPSSCLCEMAS